MANRVSIRIHNQTYRILAEEDESYIQNCAELLDKEMKAAMDGTLLSVTDGAVLAGLNIVDKFQKERAVSDNLRAQLKEALDENARLARELTELKRLTKKAAKEAKESKENN